LILSQYKKDQENI